ncbi:NHS-like protein 2 isoform X2 [Danio rerio]|uniref:NHS-like protein 2 isoform X2 n=1 Tax=Danio rerio TaxID=7955 RepID=A0A8M3BB95_DANRE|nr:NHS-like protein 2 isoform X2 [Danio rerio]|eukprot:XP_009301725.1 NHS-like protein 2 isoform X2 [Danio rerio]
MPFCKRTIVPKDVSRSRGAVLTDLVDVCGLTLCAVLRQLSDLSRQSVSILEELEGELASICYRSGALENKLTSLQKHIAALATKPPAKTATNLDSESKRTAHFQSSWQQHVNVFGSWSRPECVQELHQEAQLNLQSLLQDFEEQLYDNRVTGQTFKHPSSQSSEDTSTTLSRSPSSLNNKKTEFVFVPANKQVCEDETTTLGVRAQDPSPCASEKTLLGWNAALSPPVAEKPRWYLGRQTPAQLVPIEITGDSKILAVDLIQGACSPGSSQPRSLEPTTENTGQQHIPLRKTQSDLEYSIPPSPKTPSGMMDHATLMCPSPSWNGPKGSTFSPSWNDSYNYALVTSPASKQPVTKTGMLTPGGDRGGLICPSQTSSGLSMSSGSHSSSFTSISEPCGHRVYTVSTQGSGVVTGKRNETEVTASTAVTRNSKSEQEKRSARSNVFRFRERSLSTPTDSGSFCSADNICSPGEAVSGVPEGESYALLYPSNSSEDSTSTDNVSVTTGSDFLPDGRLRSRSRSISLKKSKKKPPPPVRSVSLMKNLSEIRGMGSYQNEGHFRDGRPKSLFIPRDIQDSFQPEFLIAKPDDDTDQAHSSLETSSDISQPADRETELGFPPHWQLNEWKSNNDPYRSLSGSSTATGTTVIECMKVRGSSESLNSPSTSRATSPSQMSIEAETKVSPFKPPCLLSPSSGYSSQSETPTPTISNTLLTGPSPVGCKMRPKIPERKSSLPASAKDKSRSRLSFELPANAQLDLSFVKPKPKASRRHSDTSTANKPGKLSPSQSSLPMVTTTDLRNIRLRSVSRSELEDSPDGSSDIIEEEQSRDLSPPITPSNTKQPKPPVAMKPPLPKRPVNLTLKSPSSSPLTPESPPSSPVDRPMPVGNIYMVVRKPKPKRPAQASLSTSAIATQEPIRSHVSTFPEFDLEHGIPIEEDLPSPSSPEREDKCKTLPSRMTISCLAELDKRKPKVPPPVPKKPSVLLLPSPSIQTNGGAERQTLLSESISQSPTGTSASEIEGDLLKDEEEDYSAKQISHENHQIPELYETFGNEENDVVVEEYSSEDRGSHHFMERETPPAEIVKEIYTETEILEENISAVDKTELHITEETEDEVFVNTPTTHTTEDLFTIIHRSKRKVLGRKEPSDSFGRSQCLVSPVKSSSTDFRTLGLGTTPRSSSRNENFMALLQKRSSKASSGTRVSAMELLKSTNPLARRVTEFSQSQPDGSAMNTPKPSSQDQ